MKEITLANEVRSILSANEQRKQRYAGDLRWLDTWKSLWISDRIRVGVIGVTSSGKSTLINALLGDDLLSVAVRPSSSQLVSCSYAKQRSAIVYFLNGEKKAIRDNAQLKNSIMQYSDENYNKQNQKQVAQLELSTPNFDLGEDVLLVDSPGLDASGYEAHEKLTLETLLPTVDVVILVTTVKSEVDKKMRQTLDAISKYKCPVMIVQNMLDAVRPSVDGKKSAATVAKERLNRVLLAVEQSRIENKGEVRVAQISAIKAMRYRCAPSQADLVKKEYKGSRYEEFVDGVKSLVKLKRPQIENQRVNTVLEHIDELIRQEDKRNATVSAAFTTDDSLNRISTDIATELKYTFDDIQSVVNELQRMFAKYFPEEQNAASSAGYARAISRLFSKDNDTLGEKEISEIKSTVKTFEARVVASVQSFTSTCTSVCQKLNLSSRDMWSYNGLPRMPELGVKTKIVERSRTVKKKGLWNAVKRFFDWADTGAGTETEYYTETVPDKEATRESVKRYIERLKREYAKTLEAWHTNAESTVSSIQREVDLRIAAIKEKEKQAIDARDWRRLREGLKKCVEQYGRQIKRREKVSQGHVSRAAGNPDGGKLLNMPHNVTLLYNAAEKYLYTVQKSSMNIALKLIGRENYPAVVVSNSSDNLSDFTYRFFHVDNSGFEKEATYHLPDKLWASCSPSAAQLKGITSRSNGVNIFLLINGLQLHTEFEAALRRIVQENLTPKDAVFFVIQDFEALANGGAISESVRDVRMKLKAMDNCIKGLALISHNNPVYNLAIIHAQTTEGKLKEETMFYGSLTSKFPLLVDEDVKKRINNILRS